MTATPTAAAAPDTAAIYRAAFDALSAANNGHEPERLKALRGQAIETFTSLGFPTTRQEEWRSTNITPIARTPFRIDTDEVAEVEAEAIAKYSYKSACEVVLVNGILVPSLCHLDGLPDGVVVTSVAEALSAGTDTVVDKLGGVAKFDNHAFVALNTALFRDGVVIRVPRGLVVEKPINVIHIGRVADEPLACFPRLLIVAEESSQVTVVEQYGTVGEGSYLTSPVLEVFTGPNAVVDHYKLQRESIDAFHMATLALYQERDSNFSSHSISWGGGIVRNDVNAILDGEGCDSNLNGLYMVEGTQLVDNHMRVEHKQPHCDSHELYKGILEGRARAVFSGRIYVHPGAQKTDAKQTNRNLLLSPEALCNSNPELEIFADDVKCTHGSTVGQLDDLAVFYLRSRGIGEEAARSLLTYAFAADIVGRIKVPEVRRDLEEFLFRRLPRGEVVRQAV